MQPNACRSRSSIEDKKHGSFGWIQDPFSEVGGGPKCAGHFPCSILKEGLPDYGFVVNFLSIEGPRMCGLEFFRFPRYPFRFGSILLGKGRKCNKKSEEKKAQFFHNLMGWNQKYSGNHSKLPRKSFENTIEIE